ncbi:shikimate dehydrogenase family protein [Thermoflavifilum thermophilum]|uniref:Shikimate dehydrogenase n=1 Tax=Thermoflavifilum thermophilum TaxID=1393122 RepID=A0A1I7N0U4_9BACT|nr:shikimate dehydrogenase [Thermoflavifilum thermophilum]SFV28186.1 shikimate dehydrogenase [Thermoflavifilum thermophilum]
MAHRFGIIGYPLDHSFSPIYFNNKFQQEGRSDYLYVKCPLSRIEEFPDLLKQYDDWEGFNVTIPYKEKIIPYLNRLSEQAAAIGAVNCIRVRAGETIGFNTDAIGFQHSLKPLLRPIHKHALILGTGGASRAVAYVLRKERISYQLVSRRKQPGMLTYDELNADIISSHLLIVNTTPAGMYPHVDEAPPLPYDFIGKDHLLFDLIYNPSLTKFLQLGQQQGARIQNGYEMLIRQAEASWEIWNS